MGNTFKESTYDQETRREPKLHGETYDFGEIQSKMEDIGKNIKEQGQKISKQITSQFKANPWPYVAGISVASWAIGYFMARQRKITKSMN